MMPTLSLLRALLNFDHPSATPQHHRTQKCAPILYLCRKRWNNFRAEINFRQLLCGVQYRSASWSTNYHQVKGDKTQPRWVSHEWFEVNRLLHGIRVRTFCLSAQRKIDLDPIQNQNEFGTTTKSTLSTL